MRPLVIATLACIGLVFFSCSSSDFSGSGAKSDAKKKDSAPKKEAAADDSASSEDPAKNKDKADPKKDAKLPDLSKAFRPANSDKVYLPISSVFVTPGSKDCKATDEAIAKCGQATLLPVKPGETVIDVVLDGVPTKLNVIVYDPANPPQPVITAAQDYAQTKPKDEGIDVEDGSSEIPGAELPPPAEPAFGGFFRKLGHETVCQIKNPLTGDCTCPAGFEASHIHEFYDGHNEYYCSEPGKCSITTFACWKKDNLTDNAAGIFRSYNTGACPNPNPFTGACSCPAGFTARPINEFSDLGERYYCTANNGPCGVQTQACTRDVLGPGNSGGFYRAHNDGTCQFPNNFTGGCSCPSGYHEALLDEFTDGFKRFYCNAGSTSCGMNVHACIRD